MDIHIRKIVICGVYITFFLAWFDGLYIELPERNLTLSAIAGFITIILWILLKLWELDIRFDKIIKKYIYFYVLYLIILFFSLLLFSKASYYSLVTPVSYFILAIVSFDVIRSNKEFNKLLFIVIISGIISSLYLIGYSIIGEGGVARAHGLLSDGGPNYSANRLLPVTTLLVSFYFLNTNMVSKIIIYVFGAITILALYFTGSVAAFVSLTIVILYLFLVVIKRPKYAIIGITLIIPIILFIEHDRTIINRLEQGIAEYEGREVVGERASIATRIERDRIGINVFLENPITGIGYGNWRNELNLLSHNSYILAITELGIFSISFFAIVFYIFFIRPTNYFQKSLQISAASCIIHMAALGGYVPKVLMIFIVLYLLSHKYR